MPLLTKYQGSITHLILIGHNIGAKTSKKAEVIVPQNQSLTYVELWVQAQNKTCLRIVDQAENAIQQIHICCKWMLHPLWWCKLAAGTHYSQT